MVSLQITQIAQLLPITHSRKPLHISISINGRPIFPSESVKYSGVDHLKQLHLVETHQVNLQEGKLQAWLYPP